MTNKKIIDIEQLKLVVTRIFSIFEEYELNQVEIEFTLSELIKLSNAYNTQHRNN